ncbi:MAG: FHA domain-containing protein [Solirubrobacterales bacterium]
MDFEPLSIALKFAFLGVLYLFLLWIALTARKDLRRSTDGGSGDQTGFRSGGGPVRDAWLVVESSESLDRGSRFDLFGGVTLGRSADADIAFTDRYASGVHARVYPRAGRYFVEDMNSTNGTLLNGAPVTGEVEIPDGSTLAIGDTSFRLQVDD